ncbi:MAG: DNA translocase FtsK 4TM domain-containing protein [Elusimicrobia bacterium]|nr:DNA translocase FtsK 4TM domain-containing protein [Elusimicrobiota bacterium]
MIIYRASLKTSKKRKSSVWQWAARWFLLSCVALWLSWLIFFPDRSGWLGGALASYLFSFLGQSTYLLPLVLFYGLGAFWIQTKEERHGAWIWTLATSLILFSCSLLLSLLGELFSQRDWGGILGQTVSSITNPIIGPTGTGLSSVLFLLLGAHLLFGISWGEVFHRVWEILMQDLQSWQRARRELKTNLRMLEERAMPLPVSVPVLATPLPLQKPVQKLAPVSTSEKKKFKLPSLQLLHAGQKGSPPIPPQSEIQDSIQLLESTLKNFGIEVRVVGISPGPVVTRYELSPAPGVKVSSIVALSNDIALSMKAQGIRVMAHIPGKSAIGVEIPNPVPVLVTLREILESSAFNEQGLPLLFAIGRSAEGIPQVADLASMPHLLVAGATNSGKSVFIHSLILSILFRSMPEEVKFLLVDPKRLELIFYEGLPHLYDPKFPASQVSVVTQPKEAAKSLKALIHVMEDRYSRFATIGARNIETYNEEARRRGLKPEFYVVVVIDELADLMLVAQDMVEDSIQRLAQMARAVGIHLVLATQRPSVDIITGVIKANLTSRVALQVVSKTDSRVILDTQGAEELLGRGDMLYLATGAQRPVRIQGAYVSEKEINQVVEYWKSQGKPAYDLLLSETEGLEVEKGTHAGDLPQALRLVLERRRVSQDLLKAHFGSSARATDLLSLLEVKGFIHKPEGTNRWEIFYDKIEEYLKSIPDKKNYG